MTDPRPYNYQYRRPRGDNRTYQSHNAYESLYHMGKVQPALYGSNYMGDHYSSRVNRYTPVYQNPYSNNIAQQIQREVVPVVAKGKVEPLSRQYEEMGINTDRWSNRDNSNRSVKSKSSSMSVHSNNNYSYQQPRNSILSNYGSNSLPREQINSNSQLPQRYHQIPIVSARPDETSKVFHKQQKPFNIINLYSRPVEPLKKFNKLTREHILLERGMEYNN